MAVTNVFHLSACVAFYSAPFFFANFSLLENLRIDFATPCHNLCEFMIRISAKNRNSKLPIEGHLNGIRIE